MYKNLKFIIMDYKNLSLEEIRSILNEKESKILDLYLVHTK